MRCSCENARREARREALEEALAILDAWYNDPRYRTYEDQMEDFGTIRYRILALGVPD